MGIILKLRLISLLHFISCYRVEHAPVISEDVSDEKVAADTGESVTMQCGARSYPAPVFTWSHGGNVVSSLGRIMTQRVRHVSETEHVTSLTITSVKSSHYGEFKCHVSNSMGDSVHTVKLVKKSKPDAPSEVSSIRATSDSILVKWKENFTGGLRNVTFKLQYRPQGEKIVQFIQSKVYLSFT